jgi:ribosomal protein S18 acetylase RimI-like enzyme
MSALDLYEIKSDFAIPGVRASACLIPVREEGRPWLLSRVEVGVESRGHGHGSALLRQVCAYADERGVALILCVASDRTRGALRDCELVSWYRRYGFREVEESYTMIRRARRSA